MDFEIIKQLSQVFFDNILSISLYVYIQSYLFLLSSDYERSEWRESIQKLQKKGNIAINTVFLKIFFLEKCVHCLEMVKNF